MKGDCVSEDQFRVNLVKDIAIKLKLKSLHLGDGIAASNQIFTKSEPKEAGFHGIVGYLVKTNNDKYSFLERGTIFYHAQSEHILQQAREYRERVIAKFESNSIQGVIRKLKHEYTFVAPANIKIESTIWDGMDSYEKEQDD